MFEGDSETFFRAPYKNSFLPNNQIVKPLAAMKTSLDCHFRRRRSFSFRRACLSQSGGYDSASLPIRRSFSFPIRRSFSFLIRRSFSFLIRWFWFYFPAASFARLRPAAFSGSDSGRVKSPVVLVLRFPDPVVVVWYLMTSAGVGGFQRGVKSPFLFLILAGVFCLLQFLGDGGEDESGFRES